MRLRTVDCVVGGFRYASTSRVVGSLLLGLYDAKGLLHHVGFTSGFSATERRSLLRKLEPLVEPPGFTGRAPGGPSGDQVKSVKSGRRASADSPALLEGFGL